MYRVAEKNVFQVQIKSVLRNWGKVTLDVGWFLQLAAITEMRLQDDIRDETEAVRKLIDQAISRLSSREEDEALVLRMRFTDRDRKPVRDVADSLNIVEGTVYKKQRQAIDDLADEVRAMEIQAVDRRQRRLSARMETPNYSELFGVDSLVDHLVDQLLTDGPPWIIAVEGMGGLGKTALADCLMRRMIDELNWSDLAWVTARQSYFNLNRIIESQQEAALTPAALVELMLLQMTGHAPYTAAVGIDEGLKRLRSRMNHFPHLVVVDNLESIADMEAILDTIRQLVGPSKFLLTTRRCPYAAGDIYHFRIPPLSPENARKLIRHEAEQRNLPDVANADGNYLHQIVDLVGGNPLALRIVVGQLHVHELENVLVDLSDVRSAPIEGMYTFLYRQAWESLDNDARSVLLCMPVVAPQGEDLAYIQGLSTLDESIVRDSLHRLVELNLVDSIGDMTGRRYAIHSLTRTFLQKHILRW